MGRVLGTHDHSHLLVEVLQTGVKSAHWTGGIGLIGTIPHCIVLWANCTGTMILLSQTQSLWTVGVVVGVLSHLPELPPQPEASSAMVENENREQADDLAGRLFKTG